MTDTQDHHEADLEVVDDPARYPSATRAMRSTCPG